MKLNKDRCIIIGVINGERSLRDRFFAGETLRFELEQDPRVSVAIKWDGGKVIANEIQQNITIDERSKLPGGNQIVERILSDIGVGKIEKDSGVLVGFSRTFSDYFDEKGNIKT